MANNFDNALPNIKKHFLEIFKVCDKKFVNGCGSYLFDGKTYEYLIDNYEKQKLLFDKSIDKQEVLEIGTYMGHSALIMLSANPKLNLTTIDIDDSFSRISIEYLKKVFPNSNIQFLHGDSISILKRLDKKFDFFHIDGSHKNKTITKEFNFCKKFVSSRDFQIVFDDDITCKTLISNIISSYNIVEKKSKGHGWVTNLYLKIDLPNNKLKLIFINIKFNLKNYVKYIISKINKIISFKKI
ncbi:O-methyltransferase [Candidatus Pelagibacter communis]|uniref:O-methyltransferase n=1 Tax=Pelagibacter ubique TaxID=198252 RepID=UPI00094CFB4B|nr:class I SAM-dependent methyltransferase [Candidatus Pelagibacter ubique]|tara:strand:+ start:321 stop:1043 length:723 start_codon:yes stop_codon:yes gene_type:complete